MNLQSIGDYSGHYINSVNSLLSLDVLFLLGILSCYQSGSSKMVFNTIVSKIVTKATIASYTVRVMMVQVRAT